MSKKHFERIAAVIARYNPVAGLTPEEVHRLSDVSMDQATMITALANHLADAMADTNPRFNREMFLRACRTK